MAKKVLIYYFSGTGNTFWVAKQLKQQLEKQNYETTIHSMENDFTTDDLAVQINTVDYVGFAYPIYGSDMPDLTREFMTKIPRFQDKKAFIFTTMLSFSGDGALVALRGLRKKGYDVKQAINIAMPNNVILPYIFFRNFPHHTKEQKIEIREQASAMIAKLADKIITEQNWQQGRDPISVVGGLIQRVPMRFIGWSRFAKNFFVNKETCIECMQCVDYCPTENITYQDGKFSWGENCILCLRCYNFCPVEAIQFKKATLDKDKFPRYKGPVEDFHPQKMLK